MEAECSMYLEYKDVRISRYRWDARVEESVENHLGGYTMSSVGTILCAVMVHHFEGTEGAV